MLKDLGVEDFSLSDLEELFNEESTQETPPADDTVQTETSTEADDTNGTKSSESKKEESKAFAKRLNKKLQEEREAIAKTMGFNSYDEMLKDRDRKLIEDKGLNPEEVAPLLDELVNKKLNADPRMKELEQLRRRQIEEFGKKELAEITKLTNGEITELEQLPKEVLGLWKTKGSLKSAYLELEGEKLINKIRGEQTKGSTSHMQSMDGNKGKSTNSRPLTDEEKQIYKLFIPKITDEELNKKTKQIK